MGESIAKTFLARKGYLIRETNYKKSFGEIDIIAEKDGVVHFVEVKSVTREMFGDVTRESKEQSPEENVTAEKLRKITITGEFYMNERSDSRESQIDVIAVYINVEGKRAQCRFWQNVL